MSDKNENWEPKSYVLWSWLFALFSLIVAISSVFHFPKYIAIPVAVVVLVMAFFIGQRYGYKILCYQKARLSLIERMVKYTCEKALSIPARYIRSQLQLMDRFANTEIVETDIEKELVSNYLQVTSAINSGIRKSIKSSPSYHKNKLTGLSLSVDTLIKFNLFKIWFMPTFPGHKCTFHEKMMEDFQKLSLREWNYFTIGLRGGVAESEGILARTKYLFITWDLTKIEEWKKDSKWKTLNELMEKLKEKTRGKEMFVVRVLILPDDWEKKNKLKILKEIYRKYFSSRDRDLYKIYFILEKDLANIDENYIQLFRDVAIFSTSDTVNQAAVGNPQSIPGNADDYIAIQFSAKIFTETSTPFLLLFAIENPSCPNNETDKVIKSGFDQRFNIVKNLWNDRISSKHHNEVENKLIPYRRKKH